MQVVKIAIAAVSLAAFGCASNVEKHFGEAQTEVTQRMIANPEAGNVPDDGIIEFEGETVESVMANYRKAQTKTKSEILPQSMILTSKKK